MTLGTYCPFVLHSINMLEFECNLLVVFLISNWLASNWTVRANGFFPEQMVSSPGFDWVRVIHLFSFLIVVLFCFVCLRLVCPMLPVSLDCPFLIAPLVFYYVYLYLNLGLFSNTTCKKWHFSHFLGICCWNSASHWNWKSHLNFLALSVKLTYIWYLHGISYV